MADLPNIRIEKFVKNTRLNSGLTNEVESVVEQLASTPPLLRFPSHFSKLIYKPLRNFSSYYFGRYPAIFINLYPWLQCANVLPPCDSVP